MLPVLTSLVLLATSVVSTLASPQRLSNSTQVVVETRGHHPSGWTKLPEAPLSSKTILLQIGLVQKGLKHAEAELLAVSDPKSPNFGKHWSSKKVAEFFAAEQHSVDTVKAWLAAHGVDGQLTKSKTWIHANVTIAQAEKLLAAEYKAYKHDVSGFEKIASKSYSVPKHVRAHIDLITPTVHFDHPNVRPNRDGAAPVKRDTVVAPVPVDGTAKAVGGPNSGTLPKVAPIGFAAAFQQANLANCTTATTLDCLKTLYNFGWYRQLATEQNSYGIVEYTPQAVVYTDLDLFFGKYAPELVGNRPNVVSIDNGVVQTNQTGFEFNGESNLDLEYGMALVPGLQVTLYQVGDTIQSASFNNFLDALDSSYCGHDDPTQDAIYPNAISCSNAPLANYYEERQCHEYLKLGLLGTTVLYSSGDYGVAGNGGECLTASGNYSLTGTKFNPSFPATCPWVTAVGATQVKAGADVTLPNSESACEKVIYSGGGFSNVFPIPWYQRLHVSSYFRNHAPSYTAAQYNNTRTVRAYPDISANGANYVVEVDGAPGLVFGTSASSPVIGSIITLINDARLALGKGPVGFINPAIYAFSYLGAINDIVSGGNQGCGTPGFTAVPGWDPVTGLGTPDFGRLLPLFLALP